MKTYGVIRRINFNYSCLISWFYWDREKSREVREMLMDAHLIVEGISVHGTEK